MSIDIQSFWETINRKIKKYWLTVVLFCIILTIFIWYFLPPISYIIPKIENTDLIIRIIFTIIIWFGCIILLLSKYFKRKNRTKLPCIGFLINSSILGENQFEKQLFFKTFKKSVKDKFKVIIYEDLGETTEKQRKKMPRKYNLMILFSIDELFASKNGNELYSIKMEKKYLNEVLFDPDLNEEFDYLCAEFVKAMNNGIEIYKTNSMDDIEKYAVSLDIQISYIIVIIYIIFSQYDEALKLLDEINDKTNVIEDININNIKKYLPLYYFSVYKFQINALMESDYFINSSEIKKIKKKLKIVDEIVTGFYKNQVIDEEDYAFYFNVLLFYKALIAYDNGKIYLSIRYINNVESDDYYLTKQLSLAFLYGSKGNYIKSYDYFLKANQRNNLQEKDIFDDVLCFINRRLNVFPNEIGLLFFKSLFNIFFGDKCLGQNQLKELITENNDILEVYYLIFSNK